MQSHTCKVHAYLAVTCHLHFWQTDRDLLRASAVTCVKLQSLIQGRIQLEYGCRDNSAIVAVMKPLGLILRWGTQHVFMKVKQMLVLSLHSQPGLHCSFCTNSPTTLTVLPMHNNSLNQSKLTNNNDSPVSTHECTHSVKLTNHSDSPASAYKHTNPVKHTNHNGSPASAHNTLTQWNSPTTMTVLPLHINTLTQWNSPTTMTVLPRNGCGFL